MRVLSIIAGLAVSSCGVSNSSATTEAAAKAAVQREFGADTVIASAVLNGAGRSAAMCGYVAPAGVPAFPRAAFIWTPERFDVSRWDDSQYAGFDRRAREVCGPSWVAPKRVPAVS
jgi:hypothetical protein